MKGINMIGLEFKYNPGYKQFLNDLLKNIDFSKLSVNILQQEIIYEGNLPCELYGKVTGGEFKKCISENGKYFISYLNMAIYSDDSKIRDIKNYNDFENSDCKLYILICDGMYYEIYFNDSNIKNIILYNLKKIKINYTEKTKDNDGRNEFWI